MIARFPPVHFSRWEACQPSRQSTALERSDDLRSAAAGMMKSVRLESLYALASFAGLARHMAVAEVLTCAGQDNLCEPANSVDLKEERIVGV